MATQPLLEARGIVRRFGHVEALRGADFSVYAGEIVALIGDNGAGKSTLVKILSGVDQATSGEILVDGTPVQFPNPQAARDHGIETVYQDLALAADLDPAANLFLGREILRPGLLGRLGVLDKEEMAKRSAAAIRNLGAALKDPRAPVSELSGGQRQSVAVVRAAMWAKRVIFMDEPTAALGVVQTQGVLDLVRRVREQGIAVVLISHNMTQVLEIADRVEVLRLGTRVAQIPTAGSSVEELVAAMTGGVVKERNS
jgi:simple sugar transport system ATP-binding protein